MHAHVNTHTQIINTIYLKKNQNVLMSVLDPSEEGGVASVSVGTSESYPSLNLTRLLHPSLHELWSPLVVIK